jgi:hypothetical protein
MTDRDLDAGLVGQLLQREFPKPHLVPVASAAVRRE